MGGGKRYALHSNLLHPERKKRLILRYCDEIFGAADPHKRKRSSSRWYPVRRWLNNEKFRGWTKLKFFISAFENSNGRYQLKQDEDDYFVRLNADHPRYVELRDGEKHNKDGSNTHRKSQKTRSPRRVSSRNKSVGQAQAAGQSGKPP
jgi:hypothetical protein